MSRKRAAPGAVPSTGRSLFNDDSATFSGPQDLSQLPDDQFVSWGAGAQLPDYTFGHIAHDGNNGSLGDAEYEGSPNISTQLVRRNPNNQVLARGTSFDPDRWDVSERSHSRPDEVREEPDANDLEALASRAKQDALSKRPPKQIPPFIQKLSRFLDEEENTELICWSERGDSFFVLDEDEFAKKLIPMLFKHDKYASFVRQLNMYGFHKKVGLSDNSMRASEQKTKTPSEYYHPYFKRARPELLWLISKPKPESKRKTKNQHDDQDSADEVREGADGDREAPGLRSNDKKEGLQSLRQEVEDLQRSQKQIYNMLSRLRDQNNQYIQQASHLIANHERHESSINAILQFLATFYNKSLEGGVDPTSMFSSAIPGAKRPQGNVMEYDEATPSPQASSLARHGARRPLALLPPPATGGTEANSPNSAKTGGVGINERSTAFDAERGRSQTFDAQSALQSARRPFDDLSSHLELPADVIHTSRSPTVRRESSSSEDITNENVASTDDQKADSGRKDIMSVIHNVNASNASRPTVDDSKFDLDSALRQYKAVVGENPFSADQQKHMLSMLTADAGTAQGGEGRHLGSIDGQPASEMALNPYLSHANQLHADRDHIDRLTRLQQQQSAKVQDLADRLHPLSPNGQIPGFSYDFDTNHEGFDAAQLGPANSDFDFDSLVPSSYFPDFGTSEPAVVDTNLHDVHTADPLGDPVEQFGPDESRRTGRSGNDESIFDSWDRPGRVLGSIGTLTEGNSPAAQSSDIGDDTGQAEGDLPGQRPAKRRKLPRQG